MIAPPDRPRNEEAERGLLSSLMKGEVFAMALDEGVSDKTFTTPLHVEIWQTMVALDKDKEKIDEVSVYQRLGRRVDVLGRDNLRDVFTACDTYHYVDRFASAARESERLRRIQRIAMEVLDRVGGGEKSDDVAEYADKSLFSLNAQSTGLKDGATVESEAWSDFMEARDNDGKSGYSTGFDDLDKLLGGGLRKGTLTILAARPSTGKTALALQLAAHSMVDRAVYFQSLEMNAGSLGKRLISHVSGVPIHQIESGKMDDLQFKSVEEARKTLRGSKLELDDKGGVSMALCRAKARRVRDCGLVLIDYCGLVTPSDARIPREQQIAGISKDAKLLAEELKCPVVLLSQLNRSVEQTVREPRLSDLRESGALEQDADNVIFLHQPDKDDKERIMLMLAKNRHGHTGLINLKFDRNIQTFGKPHISVKKGYRSPFIS